MEKVLSSSFDKNLKKEETCSNKFSEETSEILGRAPLWPIRWGSTISFTLLILILLLCWIVKFPQTINSSITVTTANPPTEICANSEGSIDKFFVHNNQKVVPGQPIALIHNSANYEDVVMVERTILKGKSSITENFVRGTFLNRDYNLGEIQTDYEVFYKACKEYYNYLKIDDTGNKKNALYNQIMNKRKYKNLLTTRHNKTKINAEYDYMDENRNEYLFRKGLISKHEYEEARKQRLQGEIEIKNSEADLSITDLDILEIKQQIEDLEAKHKSDIADLRNDIMQSMRELTSAIKRWKSLYVIDAPISGKVAFTKFWSEKQNVKTGEPIVNIVPVKNTRIIGRMKVSSANLGKIKRGQYVNIKLNSFPYMEYGMIKGTVSNISLVPEDNNYIVTVSLPSELITTYKKKIPYINQMDGIASIVIKDQSLLEQIINPMRSILDN